MVFIFRTTALNSLFFGDVVVTSYDSLKRDVDLYEKHIFAIEVIDEAQYIKNPVTQAANSVKALRELSKYMARYMGRSIFPLFIFLSEKRVFYYTKR